MKLNRGRSKASQLVIAGRRVHLFIWTPRMVGERSDPSYGFTLRARGEQGWQHFRLVLLQRNRPNARAWANRSGGRKLAGQRFMVRPSLTVLEFSRWQTRPDRTTRHGIKQYVRFKVSAGGRQLPREESGSSG